MNKNDDKTYAESMERSVSAKRNSHLKAMAEIQRSVEIVPWRVRIRQAAKGDAKLRFTNLLHHITPDILKETFLKINRNASAGVDGVTWEKYEQDVDSKIAVLHKRVQTVTYRASPSRRVMIPKPDGRERRLAIPSLEDKTVQQAMVWVLECIYEIDFKGFSYGFRPDRGYTYAKAY